MNSKILKTLEYDKIRQQIAEYTVTENGKKLVERMKPQSDYERIDELLDETQDGADILRLKGGIPRISIDWYAKGGILTKPTAFGVNGNSLMVGGEAGKEAVLPLNEQTLGAIGRGIAKTMTSNLPAIQITITGNTVREEADLHRLAELVGEKLVYELERQQGLRGVKP